MKEKRTFPIEHIPDEFTVHRRLYKQHFDLRGNLKDNAFEPRSDRDKGRISVHWDRYASLDRIHTKNRRNREYIGCASLSVRPVREIGLIVEHAPSLRDQSHSVIHSDQYNQSNNEYEAPTDEQRLTLLDIANTGLNLLDRLSSNWHS